VNQPGQSDQTRKDQPEKKNIVEKTPCQQYILQYPTQLVYDLTDSELTVLDRILFYVARYGNTIQFNQTYFGEQQGFTRQTANRAIAKFKKLGLILIKQRRIGCGILSITNYFSLPRVRAILSRFFNAYPVFKIGISMLLSEYVTAYKNKTSSPDPARRLFRIGLNRSAVNKAYQRSDKKVNEVTIRKILDIERALVARGESLDTMDTEKLAAFSDECLDSVSMQMKKAHPKQPFAFFMHLCMKWCKENNQEPIFAKADALRQLNLLSKFRASRPASIAEQIKAKEPQRNSYSQQVRDTMARERAAAEERVRRFSEVQLVDEIAGMKWHVENLTERSLKGEPGAPMALMMAKGTLARREHELSALLNPPKTNQTSTEIKVSPVRHTNAAPPTQIVNHMANLFTDGLNGDESDEDVLD